MTDFISRICKQTIVYWAFSARDGYGGATFSAPVEILGRWEDKQKLFTSGNGQTLVSSSILYLTQDIQPNDWVFLGSLSDIASSVDETNPKNVTGAKEVRAFVKSPTIKANKFQRLAFLSDSTSTR